MADQETISEFLAHHGVLGMHWGTRKSEGNRRTTSRGSEALPGETKFEATQRNFVKPSNHEIKNARKRQYDRLARGNYLYKQVNGRHSTLTIQGKARVNTTLTNLENTYTLGQDAHTARAHTTGDKVVNGLALGVIGAVFVSHVIAGKY